MAWYWVLLIAILTLIVGFFVGFFVARKVFQDQLKKNPPITESQIRAMYRQMGRTPTEKQIRQIMATMNQNQ